MVLIGLQRWPFKSLLTHKTLLLPMQVTDASKAEVARRERERLRLQAKQKKDQLEKLRDQQNDDTATGEVSSHQSFINKKMSLVNGQAVHFLQNHSGPVANIPTDTWASYCRLSVGKSVYSSCSSRLRCFNILLLLQARRRKSEPPCISIIKARFTRLELFTASRLSAYLLLEQDQHACFA